MSYESDEAHKTKLLSLTRKRDNVKSIINELLSRVSKTIEYESIVEIDALKSFLQSREAELYEYEKDILDNSSSAELEIDKYDSILYELNLKQKINKLKYATLNKKLEELNQADEAGRGEWKRCSSEYSVVTNETYNMKCMVEEDFEDLPDQKKTNHLATVTEIVIENGRNFKKKFEKIIDIVIRMIPVLLYLIYFGYAMVKEQLKSDGSVMLLCITCAGILLCVFRQIRPYLRVFIAGLLAKTVTKWWKHWNEKNNYVPQEKLSSVIVVITVALIVGILTFTMIDVPRVQNFMSLAGIALLLFLGYIGSTNPMKVQWRPVLVGLLLQLIFGFAIFKWKTGYRIVSFLGNYTLKFIAHANSGGDFALQSPDMKLYNFLFAVVPIIAYFATVVSILYYLGVIEEIIDLIAIVMEALMGTSTAESVNAAANIFLGMAETPFLIKPMLTKMTNSELHAVMTSGFTSVAGNVLGAYVTLGIPANNLISASIMSAPASLAISKLVYPETKISKISRKSMGTQNCRPYNSLLEAAFIGASTSVSVCTYIILTTCGFISVLEFVNQTLTWFGRRTGMVEDLTFQLILSYALFPISLSMGIAFEDCRRMAQLIGVRLTLNEMVAYTQLGVMIKNRKNYQSIKKSTNITNMIIENRGLDIVLPQLNMTFKNGFMFYERDDIIATYALCGFAWFGAMGTLLGALASIIPKRRREMTTFIFRALISANMACLLTACIAGLFIEVE